MMKKLLILMLVLGMTSVASAALSAIAPVVDGIVTWDVINDQVVGTGTALGTYDGMLWVISGGTLTPDPTCTKAPGVNNEAGDLGTVGDYAPTFPSYAGDVNLEVLPNQAVGEWFRFDIAFTGPDQMIVEVWNASNGWAAPVGTLTIVPEPMTIALLGLGGLFLRRRK